MARKYYVIKEEDLSKIMAVQSSNEAAMILADLRDCEVKDAVVLRKQDVFTGPALHVYSHMVAIAARLSQEEGLQRIADYFAEEAEDADEIAWKIPD